MSSSSKLGIESVIEKLRGTSKRFVDFILCLSQLQDRYGRCMNIYYKDIVNKTGSCEQTFYNNIYMAEKLGIITLYQDLMNTKDSVWHFVFNDNVFSRNEDGINKRYLNTNIDFIYSSEFKELKLNAKIMVLYLLCLKEIRQGHAKKLSFDTLMKYADTNNIYLLEQYLESIEAFFSVKYTDDGFVEVRLLEEYIGESRSANDIFSEHVLRAMCRRYKIKEYTQKDFNSTKILMTQFMQNYFELVVRITRKTLKLYGYPNADYIKYKIKEQMTLAKTHNQPITL